MRKINLALMAALVSTQVFASSTETFINGLKADLLFKHTERAIELSNHISLSKFNYLERLMSADAMATYNGYLNTLNLSGNILKDGGHGLEIEDARQIRGTLYLYPSVATIFHEMGHAELDVFIENKTEIDDRSLMNHYRDVLKPFYEKNFDLNSHTIFHEHFSYYRSEIIEFMYEEQDRIYLINGFNKFMQSCFLTSELRRLLDANIPLEEFKRFLVIGNDTERFYRKRIGTQYVYIRGQVLDLKNAQDAENILPTTHLLFWSYHQTFYDFPVDMNDYVSRMNQSSQFKETLAKCRAKLWHKHQ